MNYNGELVLTLRDLIRYLLIFKLLLMLMHFQDFLNVIQNNFEFQQNSTPKVFV